MPLSPFIIGYSKIINNTVYNVVHLFYLAQIGLEGFLTQVNTQLPILSVVEECAHSLGEPMFGAPLFVRDVLEQSRNKRLSTENKKLRVS